jgi:hypothetical protein
MRQMSIGGALAIYFESRLLEKRILMRTPKTVVSVLLIALFVGVGLSARVHAYLDPGSGSYLLQLLFAGIFGGIFAAKSLWAKVRNINRKAPGR